MARLEIYEISIDALHQLFPDDSIVAGVRVGDYLQVSWGGNKGFLYPAPVINKCSDRDTAFALADDIAIGQYECFFQMFDYGFAYDCEIWHVVGHVMEPSNGYFIVSLSDEVCVTTHDVVASEVGYVEFSTYDAAEGFAIRNVCESMPSVLVAYLGHDAFEPLRFLRWVGGPSGHDVRFGTFFDTRCPEFRFPTKNGSLLSAIRGGAR